MFGGNRRKATEHVIAQVRPLIGIVQNFSGIPPGFWRDEFVLGFIGFMISFHSNVTSGRALSAEDKGRVLWDVLTALSNMNGQEIGRRYVELATQEPKDGAFELGADYASYCAAASVGKVVPAGQVYFEQAQQIAAAQGQEHDLGVITGVMVQMLYLEPLRERFGEA